MTAAKSAPSATSVRLGRVHTNRIPEPLWQALGVQAEHEIRRDGRGEIIREVIEAHVRQQLAASGIRTGRDITMEDVEAYCQKLLDRGLADVADD